MKTWIKEYDFYRFRDEVEGLGTPYISVPESSYVKFTGASARFFFDYVLNQTMFEDIAGSGNTSMLILVAKDELSSFNEALRLLNSTLFTYRYTQETPHLVAAEFVVKVRKTQIPVSVVIPTFNPHLPALKKCIASVLYAIDATEASQSSEIIVTDDCSTNSDQIKELLCESFAGESRIKYFRLPENSGVSTARNFGLSQARHSIVFFVDHDDNVERTHINLAVQELERGGVDLVATNMRFPDQHIFCAHLSEHRGFLLENGFGSGIAVNIGSPKIKALLGTDQLYNTKNKDHFEDWELNSVAKLLGWRMVIVPYASYFYEYTDTGRDSTNLSLKRRSGLTTPLHAIQRVRKISLEQGYYCLTEYCQALVEKMLVVESQLESVTIELRRTRVAEANLVNSVAALNQKVHQLEVELARQSSMTQNIPAMAKQIVKQLEIKLARRKVAFLAYRCTIRPAIYGVYRSFRFAYRMVAGHSAAA